VAKVDKVQVRDNTGSSSAKMRKDKENPIEKTDARERKSKSKESWHPKSKGPRRT
jgi:hypothetical protein